ncbi:MAG: hypothetical protein J6X66_10640 [Lachnospiraceae bacterium]|nr:hypothetical protein [Lachnospiraceae bacterium]
MDEKEAKRRERIKGIKGTAAGPALPLINRGKSPLAFLRPYRPLFLVLAVFMLGVTIMKKMSVSDNGYELSQHLDECALSIVSPSGEERSLYIRDLARYILRIEREGDIHARAYDEKRPEAYWKLRISTDSEAAYISSMAKKTVIDYAVRDVIYQMEAERNGMELSEQELNDIHYDAEREFLKMSGREKADTCLTVDSIEENMKKETLVRKYMLYLNTMVTGGVDVGSVYYNELLSTYSVTEHSEVTGPVRPGYITIN